MAEAATTPQTGTPAPRPTVRQQTVMLVDDEEMVTTTLAAYLELESDYVVEIFKSPIAALERLQKGPVDLIISDFLMPEMDGLNFLSRVRELYPDLPAILLTGYADKENAIKAINEVSVFQYVEKPWDNDHLMLMIRNALQNKALKDVLKEKVRELDKVLFERDQSIEQYQMLNDELLLAQNVQQSLLAHEVPDSSALTVHAKYLPAQKIGGDFYDVVQLAGGKIAIFIADVTGHGIQAALITGLLKSSVQGMRNRDMTPGAILTRINKRLVNILPADMFVAALVVVIDTETTDCALANAGIPHPFLMKRTEKQVDRIAANGLLLGIAEGELFTPGEEVCFQLAKQDMLLLFTDGLTEVVNEQGQQFGQRILEELQSIMTLNSQDVLTRLADSACVFSRSKHNWDDMTLLSVEHNGKC